MGHHRDVVKWCGYWWLLMIIDHWWLFQIIDYWLVWVSLWLGNKGKPAFEHIKKGFFIGCWCQTNVQMQWCLPLYQYQYCHIYVVPTEPNPWQNKLDHCWSLSIPADDSWLLILQNYCRISCGFLIIPESFDAHWLFIIDDYWIIDYWLSMIIPESFDDHWLFIIDDCCTYYQ
jgi:hypothetical protein